MSLAPAVGDFIGVTIPRAGVPADESTESLQDGASEAGSSAGLGQGRTTRVEYVGIVEGKGRQDARRRAGRTEGEGREGAWDHRPRREIAGHERPPFRPDAGPPSYPGGPRGGGPRPARDLRAGSPRDAAIDAWPGRSRRHAHRGFEGSGRAAGPEPPRAVGGGARPL